MAKVTNQLNVWKGKFGANYTVRNTFTVGMLDRMYKKLYGITRTEINRLFLGKMDRSIRILEVGSNTGNQLLCLRKMGFKNLYGIEPQDYAVGYSRSRTKDINIIKADAFNIPFKDGYFDLVFTSGVLIHIDPCKIKKALSEICRCSRKYIWGFEYYAQDYTDVVYRGKNGLLWKADFPSIYTETFPDLKATRVERFKYVDNENEDVAFLLKKEKA